MLVPHDARRLILRGEMHYHSGTSSGRPFVHMLKAGFDCSNLQNRQVDERDVFFQEDCSAARVGLSLKRGSIVVGDSNDLFNIVKSRAHRVMRGLMIRVKRC